MKKKYSSNLLSDMVIDKLIYMDTETTGFYQFDRVFQLAMIVEDTDTKEIEKYNSLAYPKAPMSEEATKVHGYTLKSLYDYPRLTETEAYRALNKYNNESTVMFIHNASFDIRMLSYDGYVQNCIVVDTLKIARKILDEKSNKLEDLRKKAQVYDAEQVIMKSFGITEISSHDAFGDVISLKAFVDYLLTIYPLQDLIKIGKYVKKK